MHVLDGKFIHLQQQVMHTPNFNRNEKSAIEELNITELSKTWPTI